MASKQFQEVSVIVSTASLRRGEAETGHSPPMGMDRWPKRMTDEGIATLAVDSGEVRQAPIPSNRKKTGTGPRDVAGPKLPVARPSASGYMPYYWRESPMRQVLCTPRRRHKLNKVCAKMRATHLGHPDDTNLFLPREWQNTVPYSPSLKSTERPEYDRKFKGWRIVKEGEESHLPNNAPAKGTAVEGN